MEPKFCINCKHIGKNGSGDALRFKCFAPQNIRCTKPDLVTGATNTEFFFGTCYDARGENWQNCGTEGRWFEEAPSKFVESPRVIPGSIKHADAAAELLSQLTSMK